MRKRKPDNPSPVASQGANPASPIGPPEPPPARHGPAGPAPTRYGFAHLRAVLNLSTAVPIDQVCEEAACELERHREQSPRRPWRD